MSHAGRKTTQEALAGFTEWFWKTHPDDYAKWKDAVQKASQGCVLLKGAHEAAD